MLMRYRIFFLYINPYRPYVLVSQRETFVSLISEMINFWLENLMCFNILVYYMGLNRSIYPEESNGTLQFAVR